MTILSSTVAKAVFPPPARLHLGARVWWALGLVWCGLTILGWSALLKHTYQPAMTPEVVTDWPGKTATAGAPAGFRIVVFAHPCCPCTRATLQKIDESLTRLPGGTSIRVIFVTAGLNRVDVSGSGSVAFARRLPGVDVQFDDTGAEARRFGATVSGEVFAFDRQGRRVFHGGVTSGRGHAGDSAGQRQLERLAGGDRHESYTGAVFGCALPMGRPGGGEQAFDSMESSPQSVSADGA